MLERIAASISRKFFVLPGGYFVVQLLKSIFGKAYTHETWETIRFRTVTLRIDLSKQMGNAIYWRGAHDWAPIFVLEDNLNKGDTFIDVGANQGEYTLWAARKIGKMGFIVAYEPSEDLFGQLSTNITLNESISPPIHLRKIGLSDKPGKLKLYTKPGKNEGVNTLFPTKDHACLVGEVPLTTLDLEIQRLEITKLSLMKIDVEGAELHVLKGAKHTLAVLKPKLIIEINKESCLSAGYAPEEIVDLLISMDYRLFVIGLRGRLTKLNRATLPAFCNLLAIPSD